ncbi:MAG: M20/M25/M40 family metallo-hydrolase, partial [Verrucomicrobia bacterium]|nr:M20/M25/M40 family metallo-hydrolase [Verrucomicrobiota bacterium]
CTVLPLHAQEALLERPDVQKALHHIEKNYERYLKKQIEIAEIPAPPFKEEVRGRFMAAEFKRVGLQDVHTDKVGNVLGWRRGRSDQTLVISAHIDTVFPEGSDVSVKREGDRLVGKGLVDDSLGLMDLLALPEVLDAAKIKTDLNLLFVATVGEEGLGDLRGVKYLFEKNPLKDRINAFISIDGANPGVVINGALGSRRYRITVKGTGGHSWGDFGRVNPAHALGQIIARFTSKTTSTDPKTSYNIGRIGGGTSVNSIPFEAWMEVDMRSVSSDSLKDLEQVFLKTVKEGIEVENLFRKKSKSKLKVDIELIGDRPSGETLASDALVVAAQRSVKAVGLNPKLKMGSTDSNIPISMGIPAITVGGGGKSGDTHSPSEWYNPTDAHLGLQRILLLVMTYDEMGK